MYYTRTAWRATASERALVREIILTNVHGEIKDLLDEFSAAPN